MRSGGANAAFTQQVGAGRVDITITRSADATGATGTGLLGAVLFDAVAPGSGDADGERQRHGPGGTPMGLQFRPVTVTVQQLQTERCIRTWNCVRGARLHVHRTARRLGDHACMLASAVMPLARVTATRQREAELRRALREMRTAIDKYKDAADTQQIASLEIKAGSEGYPADLADARRRRRRAQRRDRAQAEVPAASARRSDDAHAPSGGCGRTRTSRTPRAGAARTSSTSTRRSTARRSTARSTGTGRRMTQSPSTSGFTLIELMVVMTIIVMLATIGMVQYRQSIVRREGGGAQATICSGCATRSISTTPTRTSTRRASTRW